MEVTLAALAGVLVAAGAYLMLAGRLAPWLIGLTMVSNAANLVIFASGRLTYGAPSLVPEGETAAQGVANALPQALILTAIVIGFGLLVFALALSLRARETLGVTAMDAMRAAEPAEARD